MLKLVLRTVMRTIVPTNELNAGIRIVAVISNGSTYGKR